MPVTLHVPLPTSFQRKHGTAERWNTCDCPECLSGRGVVTCIGELPVWWFLNCGPGGLEPLNRDPGEYSACDDLSGTVASAVRSPDAAHD